METSTSVSAIREACQVPGAMVPPNPSISLDLMRELGNVKPMLSKNAVFLERFYADVLAGKKEFTDDAP